MKAKLLPVAWMVIVPASRAGGTSPVTCLYYKEGPPKEHAALGDKVTPLYALSAEQIALLERGGN